MKVLIIDYHVNINRRSYKISFHAFADGSILTDYDL